MYPVVGGHFVELDAGPTGRRPQFGLALGHQLLEALAEQRVAGVDREQLTRLDVLDDDEPGVGELELTPVHQADGDELMALGEHRQRPLPAGLADEVGDQDDERAAPHRGRRRVHEDSEVGGGARGHRRPQQLVRQTQDLDPAAVRRDRALDGVVVDDGTDPVAAPGEQPGERGGQLHEHELLRPRRGAEAHRRRAVE
jgi:hypothetical protein